jgi:hypothetical protein
MIPWGITPQALFLDPDIHPNTILVWTIETIDSDE